MKKKSYIKPEVEGLEIETVEMIATSLIFDDEVEVDSETEQLVVIYKPNRRGKWGDLWYVEEEQ